VLNCYARVFAALHCTAKQGVPAVMRSDSLRHAVFVAKAPQHASAARRPLGAAGRRRLGEADAKRARLAAGLDEAAANAARLAASVRALEAERGCASAPGPDPGPDATAAAAAQLREELAALRCAAAPWLTAAHAAPPWRSRAGRDWACASKRSPMCAGHSHADLLTMVRGGDAIRQPCPQPLAVQACKGVLVSGRRGVACVPGQRADGRAGQYAQDGPPGVLTNRPCCSVPVQG